MISHRRLALSLISVFVFAASIFVSAQDLDDVTISGRITDSNNLPIVGATLIATEITIGSERTIVSNAEGRYKFIELKPGTYKVKASANGFGAKERVDIIVVGGQNVQLDFKLSPADVQAEATVTVNDDDSPAIDITRTIVGGTVQKREVEELPNVNRDALDLVFTLGGVSEEPLSLRDLSFDKGGRNETAPSSGLIEGGVFSLSGGAAYSNNITIDGFDNNDDRVGGIRFQPSIESIEEVQVITNQFSAEYGRASGGRANIRTSSGSQKFRGRAFTYFSDESLNANTWSNNSRNVRRFPFQQNVPGFTLGGPIPFGYFDKKTTFFTSYEYDHIFDTTITDTYIPLAQNPEFALPQPSTTETITDFGSPLGRFVDGSDTPRKVHRFTAKIDHNFNQKNLLTFGYQFGHSDDLRQFNGGNRLAESLIGKKATTHAFNIADNHVFSSKLVNQFRFQYSTLKPDFISPGQEINPVVIISFREPGLTFNTSLVAGSSTLGTSAREEQRLQFQDSVVYVTGDHSLRFGFDYQRVDSTFIDLTDASGTYNFADPLATTTLPMCLTNPSLPPGPTNLRIRGGVNSWPRGCVQRYRHNFFTNSAIVNNYFGIFAQDDWQMRERLTFNFGLRYERESVIDDNDNFGPRLGIAWSPSKNNKGVIRFGAGIFYNRVLLRTVDDYLRGQNEIIFDTNRISTAGNGRDPYLLALSNLFPEALTPEHPLVQQYVAAGLNDNSFFRSLDPNIKIPESYQFNVGFEREIGKGLVFETNFTYNKTVHLWREVNTNAPIVPAGYSDLADYLDRGITTGNVQFEFAGNTAPDSRTVSGVTIYNLNSQNTSTAVGTPYNRALFVANALKPFPTLGQTEQVGSMGNSEYKGFIFELRRRYRQLGRGFGTSLRLAYTLSWLNDDGIVNTTSAQIPGDFAAEWSRGLLDRRHRFALSGVFDTPNWMGKLRFSPILRIGSSAPYNISNGAEDSDDRNLDDVSSDRPDFSGDVSDLVWRDTADPLDLDLARAFTLAPLGRGGNLPRNAGIGPKQFIFDLNVSREWRFGERFRLRPQVEFNNILNATVFSFGAEFINFEAVPAPPVVPPAALVNQLQEEFLVPTRAYRPRQIRFGIRFDF